MINNKLKNYDVIWKNEDLKNFINKMKYKIIDNFLNQKCFDYLYSLKLKEVKPDEISVHHNKIYNNGGTQVSCISLDILKNFINHVMKKQLKF